MVSHPLRIRNAKKNAPKGKKGKSAKRITIVYFRIKSYQK
jgi:hypothetical protein